MIVAILDNGIGNLRSPCIIHHYRVQENKVLLNDEQIPDATHGSVCANIILTFGTVDEVYDIAYLDEKGRGTIQGLCTALRFCEDRKIDVINLSCGIFSFDKYDPAFMTLISSCENTSKKMEIFSAQSNDGLITVPADFPFVNSIELFSFHRYSAHLFRYSDYYVPKTVFRSIRTRVHADIEECNSFACAYACAQYTSGKLGNHVWKDLFFRGYNGFSTTAGFILQKYVGIQNTCSSDIIEYHIHEKVYHVSDHISWYRKLLYIFRKEYYYDFNLHNRHKRLLIRDSHLTLPVFIISGSESLVNVVKQHLLNSLLTDGYIPILLSAIRASLGSFENYVMPEYVRTALYEIEKNEIADVIIYTVEDVKCVSIKDGLYIRVRDLDHIELVKEDWSNVCPLTEAYRQVLALYGES